MSNYRDLNKELVEQVQSLRKNMKLYCDEIVLLKGELMEKHEAEVILRKQCYDWAVNNFLQLLQYVQPDSDILPILKEHVISQEATSSFSARIRASSRSRSSGDRYLNGQRRSSLLMEFQRSNSVLNLRKTLYSTSPIRSNGEVVNEENSVQEDTEAEENEEAIVNERTQIETLPQLLQNPIENIIYEELDDDEEDVEEERDLHVESENESVEEVSVDISPARSALKDLTNTLTKTINSLREENPQTKTIRKRGRPKKTNMKNCSDQKNTSEEHESSMELEKDADINQGIKRKHTNQRTMLTDKSAMDVTDDTFQELRRHTNARHVSETNKSFLLSQDIHRIDDEFVKSPASVISDITLKTFKDAAACSTPNSCQNSLIKAKTPPMSKDLTSDEMELTEQIATSTRPSRQCKPKDLSEPRINIKLRNEDAFPTKRKARTRSKNKK